MEHLDTQVDGTAVGAFLRSGGKKCKKKIQIFTVTHYFAHKLARDRHTVM